MCEICDNTYVFSPKQRVELTKKTESLVERAINQLHADGTIDDKTRDALFATHYQPLKEAVNEGVGQVPKFKVEYGTPNYEFLKQLQTNTAVFAAFKNHASMQDMAALLKDKDGNLVSKDVFKREALKIDSTYRGRHLDVEYNTAVGQASMGAQWQKFTTPQAMRLYPYLKYRLSTSANPRQSHLAFVGIVRKKDDPFWNTHMPRNGHECKCWVEEVDDGETDLPDNLPAPDKGFAFNPGKTGKVFDLENSNYIKSVPPREQPALIKKASQYVVEDMAMDTPYQLLYKTKKGAEVTFHPLSTVEIDYNDLVKNAISLANEGYNIQMLPALQKQKMRNALLPKEIATRTTTPDYFINSEFFAEMKKVIGTSKNSIKRPFSEVKSQSENLIIDIPDTYPFSEAEVIDMIKKKMDYPESKVLDRVWVNYKGKWLFNPHKK